MLTLCVLFFCLVSGKGDKHVDEFDCRDIHLWRRCLPFSWHTRLQAQGVAISEVVTRRSSDDNINIGRCGIGGGGGGSNGI